MGRKCISFAAETGSCRGATRPTCPFTQVGLFPLYAALMRIPDELWTLWSLGTRSDRRLIAVLLVVRKVLDATLKRLLP